MSKVVRHEGSLHSLSNRRLFVFRVVANLKRGFTCKAVLLSADHPRVLALRYDRATQREQTKWWRAYSTTCNGWWVHVWSDYRWKQEPPPPYEVCVGYKGSLLPRTLDCIPEEVVAHDGKEEVVRDEPRVQCETLNPGAGTLEEQDVYVEQANEGEVSAPAEGNATPSTEYYNLCMDDVSECSSDCFVCSDSDSTKATRSTGTVEDEGDTCEIESGTVEDPGTRCQDETAQYTLGTSHWNKMPR